MGYYKKGDIVDISAFYVREYRLIKKKGLCPFQIIPDSNKDWIAIKLETGEEHIINEDWFRDKSRPKTKFTNWQIKVGGGDWEKLVTTN